MNELSPEARAVLDAARDADAPTPADRQRVRAALFAQIGLAAAASTAATAASSTAAAATRATGPAPALTTAASGGKLALGLKLLAGVALVGGLGGGYLWYRSAAEKPAPTITAEPTPVAIAPAPAPEAEPLPAPALAPELGEPEIDQPEPAPAPATRPARRHSAPRRAVVDKTEPAPAPAAAPADPLAALRAEKELIGGAKRALDAGDPSHALTLLAQHANRFPDGVLAQDRVGTRVLALCAAGDLDQARKQATSYLARWPRGSMAARVKNSCGGK